MVLLAVSVLYEELSRSENAKLGCIITSMSDNAKQWLTAGEAGRILHMSERQVNRYGAGENARLTTNRAGRRVLYLASDVYELADELRVDIKPAPQRTAMIPPEMVQYMQDQANLMRQQGETQASIDRRLAEIEQRLAQSSTLSIPRWIQVAIVVIVVLAAASLVVQFLR